MRNSAVFALVANFLVGPAIVSAWSIPHIGQAAQAVYEQLQQVPELATGGASAVGQELKEVGRYDGQQVWRLQLGGVLARERDSIRGIVEKLDLDIWRNTPSVMDIRLSPEDHSTLSTFLPYNANLTLFVPDVQALVDGSRPSLSAVAEEWDVNNINTPFHDQYHPIADIYRFAEAVARAFNGRAIADGKLRAEVFSVGKSYEGNEIKGLRVKWVPETTKPSHTAKPEPLPTETGTMTETPTAEPTESVQGGKKHKGGGKKKKGGKEGKGGKGKKQIEREFVIQSGSHAREWVGPSSAIYFLHSLLLDGLADHESEQAQLLKAFTFSIIPTINPDGYEYSRSHRMWRKNRQDVGARACTGIDLNTNWGYKWQKPTRPNPCSDAFPGKNAFEAYETKAMAEYLNDGVEWAEDGVQAGNEKSKAPERKVRAFVDLHSYGQLFMFPFAHSCDDFPPDAEMLMEAALGVSKAMRAGHGETYQTGQACELTYRAPGDAIDYAYGTSDVRWSYSAELRDTGTYGFLLPPSLIRPAADEITTGLVHLAKFIYNVEVVN